MAFDITTARPVQRDLDIPTLRKEQPEEVGLPGESRVQRIISERADPVQILQEEVETPFDFAKHPVKSALKPFVTTAKMAAVPIERVSAAVGGLGLGLQKGKGFKESFEMAGRGLRGEEQFRAFDPVTAAGAPPIVATGLELFSQIAIPLKVLGKVNQVLRGPITKITDKGLLKAGGDLIKASDDATTAVGTRLNQVYQPINNVKVDPKKIFEEISDLDPAIVKHLRKNVGDLNEFLDGLNIQKARELKRVLGELRPTAFGKAERGAIDLITDKQINRTYGVIKQSMQNSLNKAKLSKEGRKLLEADDLFSQTKNASRFVKRTITDPTLRAPTKVGRAASGLERAADISFRRAINILKETGFKQSRMINRAVRELERFNRLQKIQKFGAALGRSAVIGGVGGAAAGKVLKPLLGQERAAGGQTGQNLP